MKINFGQTLKTMVESEPFELKPADTFTVMGGKERAEDAMFKYAVEWNLSDDIKSGDAVFYCPEKCLPFTICGKEYQCYGFRKKAGENKEGGYGQFFIFETGENDG